jgi:hypothetical protein
MTITTTEQWQTTLTADQNATYSTHLRTLMGSGRATGPNAGVTNGSVDSSQPGFSIRTWTTLDAANEWITFINGFTPPPIVANVSSTS